MMFAGKTFLVTGVTMESSIAFAAARLLQEQGASVILTGFGKALKITTVMAKRLPQPAPVIELDVADQSQLDSLSERLKEHTETLDGVVHSIGFAPPEAFDFMNASWEDVAPALHVSAFSLKSLSVACKPLLSEGSGVVGLTFDASVAWPVYDWMGVAKAAFESTARYLARDLGKEGIRVNLVAAGPIRTTAARSIPGFDQFEDAWQTRAPLGWDVKDNEPAAKACVALLSDWFPSTTGEIVHVDGGFHAMGT